MAKRTIVFFLILVASMLWAPTASSQGFQTAVEIECDQSDAQVNPNPKGVTSDDIQCTVSNPSMHPETIEISTQSEQGTNIDLSERRITLQPGGEEQITATLTPSMGLWAGTYSITLTAEVVEVYGAPPPTYVYDETSANYDVMRYTDFIIEDCFGMSAGFNSVAPISAYCLVFSASNFYDEYVLRVEENSKSNLEKYGYTFNQQSYANGVKVSENTDGTVYFDIPNLFTIEAITDEWTSEPSEDNVFKFTDWVTIEIESVYSSSTGQPHIETSEMTVTSTAVFDEEEVSLMDEDRGDAQGNFLPHLTAGHVISMVFLAVFVAKRREVQHSMNCGAVVPVDSTH